MEHCQNVVVEQEYVSNLLVGPRVGPEVAPTAAKSQKEPRGRVDSRNLGPTFRSI